LTLSVDPPNCQALCMTRFNVFCYLEMFALKPRPG
jgi:hypothetical protein